MSKPAEASADHVLHGDGWLADESKHQNLTKLDLRKCIKSELLDPVGTDIPIQSATNTTPSNNLHEPTLTKKQQ